MFALLILSLSMTHRLSLFHIYRRTVCRHSEHHRDSLAVLASRPPYASVATGNKHAHVRELEELLRDSFDISLHASSDLQ